METKTQRHHFYPPLPLPRGELLNSPLGRGRGGFVHRLTKNIEIPKHEPMNNTSIRDNHKNGTVGQFLIDNVKQGANVSIV